MKITETRKAIIELIEPYMDKELEFGCLIKHIRSTSNEGEVIRTLTRYDKRNNELDLHRLDSIGFFTQTRVYDKHIRKNIDWGDEIKEVNGNVIGHYDITAVLKYMLQKLNGLDNQFINEEFIIFTQRINGQIERYYIPNKPLHLYTEEEEDKKLLDLLQKLGT